LHNFATSGHLVFQPDSLTTSFHSLVNCDTRDSTCLPLLLPATLSSARCLSAGCSPLPTGTPTPPATGDSDSSKSCPPARPDRERWKQGSGINWVNCHTPVAYLLNAIAVVLHSPQSRFFGSRSQTGSRLTAPANRPIGSTTSFPRRARTSRRPSSVFLPRRPMTVSSVSAVPSRFDQPLPQWVAKV
jgi:hypothetical protein